MLNRIFLGIILISSTMACNRTREGIQPKTSSPDAATTQKEINAIMSDISEMQKSSGSFIWTPPKTKMNSVNNRIEILAPNDYTYISVDGSGGIVVSNRPIGITCTCLDKGSCDPFLNGNTYGCLSQTCTHCDIRVIQEPVPVEERLIQSGGFVKADFSVSIANSSDVLPMAFPAMFKVHEIKQSLNRFYSAYYKSESQIPDITMDANGNFVAPSGHYLVVLNIAGRAAVGILPIDKSSKATLATGPTISCQCNSKGRCAPGAGSGGTKVCLSNNVCTSCSMAIQWPDQKTGVSPTSYLSYKL